MGWLDGFRDKRGSEAIVQYDSANGVFTVDGVAISGSAPSYTWAGKPAAAAGNKNKYIVITDLIETAGEACLFQSDGSTWKQRTIPRTTFAKAYASTNLKGTAEHMVICTDIGLGGGIELVSNGTYLYPPAPQLLYKQRYGTITTPTLTLSATGKFTLSADPTFQANLFHAESEIQVRAKTVRTGSAASLNTLIYLGTNGTSSDSQIVSTAQSVANTHCTSTPTVQFVSTSALIATGTSAEGGNGTSGQFVDRSTAINTAAEMKLSVYSSQTNPDTLSLQTLEVWWKA